MHNSKKANKHCDKKTLIEIRCLPSEERRVLRNSTTIVYRKIEKRSEKKKTNKFCFPFNKVEVKTALSALHDEIKQREIRMLKAHCSIFVDIELI